MPNFFRFPCTHTSPVVQEVIKIIDQHPLTLDELTRELGTNHVNVWKWRNGMASPHLTKLEKLLYTLGYELKVVKR